MKNYQILKNLSAFAVAVAFTAMLLTGAHLSAAETVKVSGAICTAEIEKTDNKTMVTGRLAPTKYGGLAWPNHYHVSVMDSKGQVLNEFVYRHGLKAPKAQSRQSTRPYRFVLEEVSADEVSVIHVEQVTTAHGFCS